VEDSRRIGSILGPHARPAFVDPGYAMGSSGLASPRLPVRRRQQLTGAWSGSRCPAQRERLMRVALSRGGLHADGRGRRGGQGRRGVRGRAIAAVRAGLPAAGLGLRCGKGAERAGAAGGAVAAPTAWLTTVVTHLCLKQLGSARRRRERCTGTWLPEPVVTSDGVLGPLETAEQRESVSFALLVLLERLSAAERAVFVLREAFGYRYAEIAQVLGRPEAGRRQLHRRAARRLGGPTWPVGSAWRCAWVPSLGCTRPSAPPASPHRRPPHHLMPSRTTMSRSERSGYGVLAVCTTWIACPRSRARHGQIGLACVPRWGYAGNTLAGG
jgi:hypothetical protein